MIMELAAACAQRGVRIRLVAAPGTIAALVVRIAALDDELPTFETLAEALGTD